MNFSFFKVRVVTFLKQSVFLNLFLKLELHVSVSESIITSTLMTSKLNQFTFHTCCSDHVLQYWCDFPGCSGALLLPLEWRLEKEQYPASISTDTADSSVRPVSAQICCYDTVSQYLHHFLPKKCCVSLKNTFA